MNYAEAIAHLYAMGPELAPVAAAEPGGGVTGAAVPRRRFDLDHMRVLCAALGDPQTRVPAVLIAGTNGKGSTAATLASILAAAGYRTGLYTSPHLVRVNERIQLARPVLPSEYGAATVHGADGLLALTPIADELYAQLYTQVDATGERLVQTGALPQLPSFFERLTAVAFLYFAGLDLADAPPEDNEASQSIWLAMRPSPPPRAEIVVLEVGLGGRLDATNVVEPLLSILTDIALDHQADLGNTIAEITREKAGILRRGGVLITLPQLPEANQAIGEVAVALGVRGISAADYVPPAERSEPSRASDFDGVSLPAAHNAPHQLTANHYRVRLEGKGGAGESGPGESGSGEICVESPLAGVHQQRNIALAIAAAVELRKKNGFVIPNACIEEGIRRTQWPGRLEAIAPNLLLDVAHNPAGAWTLRAALASLPESRPRTLIFSCLRDKDLTEMARILFPLFDSSADGDPLRRQDHILLAPIANPRAASVGDLLAAAHALGIPAHAAPHIAGALAEARRVTPEGGLIVATGSVYLVGELRQLALDLPDSLASSGA